MQCKYCGCAVSYKKDEKKFYEEDGTYHDYEKRCKPFQKSGQFKQTKTPKQESLTTTTKSETPLIDISKLGYDQTEVEAANKRMDAKLNSIIYTIHHVTLRLKEVGITNPNPQLVGMITKILREESRE